MSQTNQELPTGTIVAFGGTQAIPVGWRLCNGESYDKNDPLYRNLYNAIQTTWGGDGNPSFNVPNFQGIFLRGTVLRNDPEHGVGVTGGTVSAVTGYAEEAPYTETYEGHSGGEETKRVPGLSHSHTVKIEPPYAYVYYIIKL